MQQRLLSRWSQAVPRPPMSDELWVIGWLYNRFRKQYAVA